MNLFRFVHIENYHLPAGLSAETIYPPKCNEGGSASGSAYGTQAGRRSLISQNGIAIASRYVISGRTYLSAML